MNKCDYPFKGVDKMGFPVQDYDFPAGRGEFTGTLVHKRWVPNRGLLCYFDIGHGEKYKLGVWYRHFSDPKQAYHPKYSDIDISGLTLGSRMRVTYGPSSTGETTIWLGVYDLERYVPQQGPRSSASQTKIEGVTDV
jgi:hypothetical protein